MRTKKVLAGIQVVALVFSIALIALVVSTSSNVPPAPAPEVAVAIADEIGMPHAAMIVGSDFVLTIDRIEETAIGEPVARAKPIMMSALNVRYEESTSHVLTIGHDMYAKNANFSATLIARANGSPPTANERGSVFATSNDPADETFMRATARNGSQRMTSSS